MSASLSAVPDLAAATPPSEMFRSFLAWADAHPQFDKFSLSRRDYVHEPRADFVNVTLEQAHDLVAAIPWEQQHRWDLWPVELRKVEGHPLVEATGHAFGLAIQVIAALPVGDE